MIREAEEECAWTNEKGALAFFSTSSPFLSLPLPSFLSLLSQHFKAQRHLHSQKITEAPLLFPQDNKCVFYFKF